MELSARASRGKDNAPIICDEDIVFNPDAEAPGDINGRLDCNHVAHSQCSFGPVRYNGQFVDLQAQSMSGSVAIDRQTCFFYDFFCGGIDAADFDTRFDRLECGSVRLFYNGVNSCIQPAGGSYRETSGQVAAVAVVPRAEVDEDGIIFA